MVMMTNSKVAQKVRICHTRLQRDKHAAISIAATNQKKKINRA
jgi:hypothetical protein